MKTTKVLHVQILTIIKRYAVVLYYNNTVRVSNI